MTRTMPPRIKSKHYVKLAEYGTGDKQFTLVRTGCLYRLLDADGKEVDYEISWPHLVERNGLLDDQKIQEEQAQEDTDSHLNWQTEQEGQQVAATLTKSERFKMAHELARKAMARPGHSYASYREAFALNLKYLYMWQKHYAMYKAA